MRLQPAWMCSGPQFQPQAGSYDPCCSLPVFCLCSACVPPGGHSACSSVLSLPVLEDQALLSSPEVSPACGKQPQRCFLGSSLATADSIPGVPRQLCPGPSGERPGKGGKGFPPAGHSSSRWRGAQARWHCCSFCHCCSITYGLGVRE